MNKYVINIEQLLLEGITIEEFIFLISIVDDNVEILHNLTLLKKELEKKGFIKIIKKKENENIILREKSKILINSLIINESKTTPTLSSFDDFVKIYRKLFKISEKPGIMGNAKSCKEKLKRWMIENPKYSQEDILKATRIYINSLNDFKYMKQADYFIYKKDRFGESSKLLDFIDEDDIIDEGWGSKLS